MDVCRGVVGRVFLGEDGEGRASDGPIPDVLFVDSFASHGRKVLFRGEVEGGLGPVVEVDLTRSPARGDFFIVGPTHNGPSLSLSMLEVHNNLSSENVPNFEIGSVNVDHV